MKRNMIKPLLLTFLGLIIFVGTGIADVAIIPVSATSEISNDNLQQALREAARKDGSPIVIKLETGTYYLSREASVKKLYYISNTTSEEEDPDPTKHIGLWLNELKNVTIDGNGSTLVMTGEMTSFVIDLCENITFRNINFDYQYPTQTELKIVEEDEYSLVAQVHPRSKYRIDNEKLTWYGDGWSFSEGIAQAFDPEQDITWRTGSPMSDLTKTVELEENKLQLFYSQKPKAKTGLVYQLRDAIRDEVCGFVHRSKDIKFENVNFYYLGNFGIVCQYSENVTFDHAGFAPEPGSGRTNAGFADFIQASGCKGLIDIKNSRFTGAHDDPINIHGTHLKVMEYTKPNQIKIRFMHHQSYGFEAFFKDDDIEFIDSHSLQTVGAAKVKEAKMINPREILLTLYEDIPEHVLTHKELSVENITWTPDVKITNNYFSRIPSRGVLVTTRGKVLLENNTFYRMQMSGVLIANDALSWYESGKVTDVTIKNNYFIECGSPVILIEPENKVNEGSVHRNITIENNKFRLKEKQTEAIRAKSVDGLIIRNNLFIARESVDDPTDTFIKTTDCQHLLIQHNRIEKE